jgi:tetratricopeptide (TPR) repeat protein
MKMTVINFSIFIFYITFGLINTFAQSTRELINNGVDLYNEQKFADAEVNFKKGNEKSPDNFEAKFNLGDAYYKQQRYDEAMKSYQTAFVDAKNDLDKSKIYYNVGNSLLKSQKVKESIGAYKEALKLNPDDQQAKYNLSYALNQLKNPNQDQNQNNDKNKDQKDQNKDQQNKDQQNQDQQNKDQQNQDQEKQDQQQQQQQSKEQKEQELTKQEAEKILNALKENEKDLQKQLRKVKGQPIKTEKDW